MLDYQYGDELPVHEHGYVKLLDIMGSDEDIVDAARISYDRRGKTADRALIRYLLRHKHTSPFEMAEMKFELKMPIFVARQWVRHRTANMNEVSARYTELPNEMFVPEELPIQSTDNKQGRTDETLGGQEAGLKGITYAHDVSYSVYEDQIKDGVSREIARGVLPLNIYTKFVWKMDLHNLMHFLNLRLDPHAQKEIRDYAEVMERLMRLKFPLSSEAFRDYVRDSYTLSRMECSALISLLDGLYDNGNFNSKEIITVDKLKEFGLSERESKEFKEKFGV